MKTALFDFELPESSIAHFPSPQRENARLLHVTTDRLTDYRIYQLTELLDERDVLVFNNTRVIPARLFARRDEVSVEILLHKQVMPCVWDVFAKPAKRLKVGQILQFAPDVGAEVLCKHEDGQVRLGFALEETRFWDIIQQLGQMPLPPYIDRTQGAKEEDKERYQTVYAQHHGSVAAPTAGLHFTDALLEQLRNKGVQTEFITLHVGGGTFLPVKVEDTAQHQMHSEYAIVSEEVAARLTDAKRAGKRIVAVGTTSLRTLESATDEYGVVHPFQKETAIFITPGYHFKCVDRLITNFHLPKSTLFMLVSAFSGLERMKSAYAYAIHSGYRFYSYGDACLLEKSMESE